MRYFLLLLALPSLMFASATPDNSTVGATTNYSITFTMGALSSIAVNGTITVTFPAGYTLPSTMIASSPSGVNNIDGGFLPATPAANSVTFTRDGTGTATAGGGTFTIIIGTATNPTTNNTYTISVTTSAGGPIDPSSNVSIGVGAIANVFIESAAGGAGSEVTTISTTTDDDSQQFFAVGRDAFDNFVSDVSVTWGVIGNIGTVGGAATSTTLTLTTVGSGVVTANDGSGHTDQTGQISVSAGALASINVVEGASGDGPEFTTRTITADQALTLHAAGYDTDDNYTGDESVTWSVTGGIGTVSPSTGTSTEFDATTTGSGTVVATHGSVGADATGTITVNNGALDYVRINTGASGNTSEVTTDAFTVGSGGTTVHASGYDSDDNYLADQSVTWSVIGGIGSVSPTAGTSTTFTPEAPGTGVINADHATAQDDQTGTLTVSVGTVTTILIRNAPDNGGSEVGNLTITADDELTLYAAGYDAENNYVSDVSVTWSSANLTPAVSGTGSSVTFSPTVSGVTNGVISATHAGSGDTDNTGTITVNDGALNYVRINSGGSGNTAAVTTESLTTDETLTVHASGYDADGNYRNDVTVDWSVTGGIGSLSSSTGTSTTLSANTVGEGVINADHATAIDDVTGAITVTVGALTAIKIVEGESGDGPELTTRSVNTDQALTVHAAGYDGDDNYTGDESVTWSVTGGIGDVSPTTGTSTIFDPTTAGSGTIVATHGSVGTDATGTITVSNGALNYVRINTGASGNTSEVTTAAFTVGGGGTAVHASGYDSDDNYLADQSVTWSVIGGIGSVSPSTGTSTTFTPEAPGFGVIQADHATAKDDQTGTLTVTVGTVASILIRDAPANGGNEVGNVTLTADDDLTLYAAGYDAENNYVTDVSVTWSSSNLTPAVSSTGSSVTFSPTVSGVTNGVISATHAGSGDSDNTGTITVTPGAPFGAVTLTPDPATIQPDSTSRITSSVIQDQDGNQVGSGAQFDVQLIGQQQGTITTTDANVGRGGVQINTNASSQLVFDFKANTTAGGSQNISVNSVNGNNASGDTVVRIGSVQIISIANVPDFTTRGQTNVTNVQMRVLNQSALTLQNPTPNLTFSANGITAQRTDTITEILSGQTVTFLYTLTVAANADLGLNIIDGQINGTIDVQSVSASGATSPDSTIVQLPAQIRIDNVVAAPDTVQHGDSGIPFAVTVTNPAPAGAASAVVILDSLKFTLLSNGSDQASNFLVTPDIGNAPSVPAQTSRVFNYNVNVFSSAAVGSYTLDAYFVVQDTNAANLTATDNAANVPDTWVLQPADNLKITSISPFPPTVTAVRGGQVDDWVVRMGILNGSPDSVDIDTSLTSIEFRVGGTSLTDQFTIIKPSQLVNAGGFRLASGAVDSLDFIIDTTADTSNVTLTISGRVTANVVGSGNPISDAPSDVLGSIQLTSSNATVSVQNTNPVNAPNSTGSQANVNINQNFQIEVEINNDLGEAINQVIVELATNGNSIIAQARDTIPNIGSNTRGSINFDIQASSQINTSTGETFTATLISALGAQSGQPALVGPATNNTFRVFIQNPAQLSVAFANQQLTPAASLPFEIIASVSNPQNAARYDNGGQLSLTLPPNYQIDASSPSPNPAPFSDVETQISWQILAPSTATDSLEDLVVTIGPDPQDINNGQSAIIAVRRDTIKVQTLQVGLSIAAFRIANPPGAQDATVSTEQNFTAQLDVQGAPSLDNITATIELPDEGFELREAEVPQKNNLPVGNTSVTWQLRAGTVDVVDTIKVTVQGFVNGQPRAADTSFVVVTAVERANLNLGQLTTSVGSGPVNVSLGQAFNLIARVTNGGIAGVEGRSELTLTVPSSSGIAFVNGPNDSTKSFVPGQDVVWQLQAPNQVADPTDLSVRISGRPTDENSNQLAALGISTQTISIQTVNTGTVIVTGIVISGPEGAQDSTISTDQQITLRADYIASNIRNGQLSLELPASYNILVDLSKPIPDTDEGGGTGHHEWTVQAPGNASNGLDTLRVIGTATDFNSTNSAVVTPAEIAITTVEKARLRLSANVVDDNDLEFTTGQTFTIEASLTNLGTAASTGLDSIFLQLPLGNFYTAVSPLTQVIAPGQKASWSVVAPGTDRPNETISLVMDEDNLKIQDENNIGVPVTIQPSGPAQINLTVRTRAIGLDIGVITTGRSATAVRGATDIYLFGLRLKNTSNTNINLRTIDFKFKDGQGNLIEMPGSLVSRFRATPYQDNSTELASANDLDSNPVQLNFGSLTIPSSDSVWVQFLTDLLPESAMESFLVTMDPPATAIFAQAVGSTNAVAIRNADTGLNFTRALDGGLFAVIDGKLDASFFNYPNPFGSTGREVTYFNYNLSQDSDVVIKIYTLFGHPVKTLSFDSGSLQGSAGNHSGEITWNGRNGQGDEVRNGVYIAVITTNQGTAHTKIAFAK